MDRIPLPTKSMLIGRFENGTGGSHIKLEEAATTHGTNQITRISRSCHACRNTRDRVSLEQPRRYSVSAAIAYQVLREESPQTIENLPTGVGPT